MEESTQPGGGRRVQRSRMGCITCRIRRVKCDETKPQCNRCAQSGRTCDGYLSEVADAPRLSRRDLAVAVRQLAVAGPASRVLSGPHPAEDPPCFDFFRQRTAAMTGSIFPSDFWSRVLLQAAHAEPVLWKVTVALGAMHRFRENARLVAPQQHGSNRYHDGAESMRFRELGLRYYAQALSLAKSIGDPKTLLAVSVAFAALANLAGIVRDTHVHIRSGMQLLSGIRARDGPAARSEMESIAQSLALLDLQNMSFSDTAAPYEHVHDDDRIPRFLPFAAAGDFARSVYVLVGLGRALFSAREEVMRGQISEEQYRSELAQVVEITAMWEDEMMKLLTEGQQADTAHKNRCLLAIKAYHAFLRVFINMSLSGPETRWDVHLPYFERVVAASAQHARASRSPLMPFLVSLEPGFVLPLFLVVSRCRHPVVRRRALALMKTLDRQEGILSSAGAVLVAEQWILTEEENVDVGLPLYLDDPDPYPPNPDLTREKPGEWLGLNAELQSRQSWDGYPEIRDAWRILMDDIHFDGVGKINLVLHLNDRDATGALKTRAAVVEF